MAEETLKRSEVRLKNILAASPDAITVSDLNGNITECNQATLDMGGFSSKDEVIGKNALEFIAKKDRKRAMENLKKTLEQGSVKNVEYTFLTKDGREYPVELSASVIIDSSGNPTGFVAITKDITERKRTEEALRRSEEQTRHLLEFRNKVIDTTVVWIDLLDVEGNVTLWNRAAELISGYSREEVVGHKKIWEWLYPDPKYRAEIFAKAEKDIERGERVENYETTIRCKDGTLKTIRWYGNSILDERGKPVGLIAVGLDVTEIKKAQERIRESEEKYRSIVELAPEAIITMDLKGVITSCNNFMTLSGYSKDEIVGKHFSKIGFFQMRDIPKYLKILSSVVRGKVPEPFEVSYRHKDGELHVGEVYISLMKKNGKTTGLQAISRDITERKKAEEELEESRRHFQTLFNVMVDPVVIVDGKGKFLEITDRVEEITGFKKEELLGKNFLRTKIVTAKSKAILIKNLAKRMMGMRIAPYEVEVFTKDGKKLPYEVNAAKIEYKGKPADLVVFRDISERKKMEEELREYTEHLEEIVEERTRDLREAERMAAIGRVAGMVGHDLRNPLQAIVNTLYLAKEMSKTMASAERRGVKELLKTLEEQVGYMNKIVSDLQDYARPVRPEPVPTSLPQLINEVLSTLTVPETIKVSKVISEDFPELMVDPVLMRRVFTNLVTNALQAMPDGGQLTIRSSKTGETAFISVQDTGGGIPKEDLPKLFQPLFTTKSKGQGFGLPVCKRLVEAHDGGITVESEVGKGSTFTVKIPLRREVS